LQRRTDDVIRVLLAEDQAMVRGALSALLGMEEDLEVVGAAADGESAWRDLQRLKPDLLVTDIEMPGLSGLELAQRIQRHELPTKVVIVTTFGRAGFLRRALDAGVCGYLLKDAPAEDLATALRKVARSTRNWQWMRGDRPTRSTTVSGRCCGWQAKVGQPEKSPLT
jgi:two-component system response regulator DesR